MRRIPVILVSGWAHGTEALAPIAEALAGRHAVHCAPLPHPAPEDKNPAGDESRGCPSLYAMGIRRLIGECGGRAFLIGWSAGGIAALETAARFPGEVAGLALLGATARFCSGEGYPHGTPRIALRAMRQGLRKNPEAILEDFFIRASLPAAISKEDLARKTNRALDLGCDFLSEGLNYLERTDLVSSLKTIRRPALAIHGKDDRIIPWQAAEFLSGNIPHCTADFLSGAGHGFIDSHTEPIVCAIRKFLEVFQNE